MTYVRPVPRRAVAKARVAHWGLTQMLAASGAFWAGVAAFVIALQHLAPN